MRKIALRLLAIAILMALPAIGRVDALGGSTLTAPTRSSPVSIDGSLGPSEWSDGTHLSNPWTSNNASLTSGVGVWVKTNGTDLLLAVGADGPIITNPGPDTYNYTLSLLFDNDNNGVVNNNEDAKGDSFTVTSPGVLTESYSDRHYDSTSQQYVSDVYENGTASGSHSPSGAWVWEFAIPLSSSYVEDFTLAQNASIGFEIVYAEQHFGSSGFVSSGWAYWEGYDASYSTTGFPTGSTPTANGWPVIVWTNLQAPISDTTPPTISAPKISPIAPGPGDKVTVFVNVTDSGSGVKNVSMTFTTDKWKTNTTVLAPYNITTTTGAGQILAQQFGGHVEYYITAFDNAGNKAVNNNNGSYFAYDVGAPFYAAPWFYALIVALVAIVAILAFLSRRRKQATPRAQTPP